MSSIDPSMENMLETFIYESTSLLDELDEIMLDSEKSKSISEKNINEIFRIMHTIKGSAAMMGLETLSNFAHVVEDVFFILREDPSKLNLVMDTLFDLLFQAEDFIKAELDAIQGDGNGPDQDPSELMKKLEAQVDIMNGTAPSQSKDPAPAADTQPAAPEAPAAPSDGEHKPASLSGNGFHQIRVFFEDGCQMENIRGFMLLTQLKDYCDELESVPANPQNDANLCNEIIKNGFLVRFKTSGNPEDVIKVIESSVNIKSYEVLESQPDPEPAQEEQPQAVTSQPAPAAAPEPQPQSQAAPKQEPASSSLPKVPKQNLINVNQVKLDQLMDLVGEIVTAESMVSSNPDLKGLQLDNFYKSTRELRKLTDELQDVVMSIRMVPLSGVFQKMNRIVRNIIKLLNKDVELDIIGGDTEVDKTINDSLSDPLMHMIRNSVDHAIEPPEERQALGKPVTGKVTLSAQNIGGEIVITIADDGCGLDREKLLKKARENGLLTKPESDYTDKEVFGLIMLPGFSTNTAVTEYSGRGVGMDVVRKNIEKVGGTVNIDSTLHEGTTFTVKIPLTLAIVDGMEISVGGTIFTLPITSIKQSFKISDQTPILHNTDGTEMIMLRETCYPIIRLYELFNMPNAVTNLEDGIIIQIEYGDRVGCIFADELIGEQQVVVKPFPLFLSHYNIKDCGLSGCTILGDGSISLILDANSLLKSYER